MVLGSREGHSSRVPLVNSQECKKTREALDAPRGPRPGCCQTAEGVLDREEDRSSSVAAAVLPKDALELAQGGDDDDEGCEEREDKRQLQSQIVSLLHSIASFQITQNNSTLNRSVALPSIPCLREQPPLS